MRAASSSSCGRVSKKPIIIQTTIGSVITMWVMRDRPHRADQPQHLEQGEQRDQVGQARRHAAQQQHGREPVGLRLGDAVARRHAEQQRDQGGACRSHARCSRSREHRAFVEHLAEVVEGRLLGMNTGGQAVLSMSYLSDSDSIQKNTNRQGASSTATASASAALSTALRSRRRPRLPRTPFPRTGLSRASVMPTSPSAAPTAAPATAPR